MYRIRYSPLKIYIMAKQAAKKAQTVKIAYQYAKIKPERREWLGERWFRFHMGLDHILQIVSLSGEVRRGRSNNVGITLIHKTSFLTNYFAMGYLEPVSKKEFDSAFEKTVEMLK